MADLNDTPSKDILIAESTTPIEAAEPDSPELEESFADMFAAQQQSSARRSDEDGPRQIEGTVVKVDAESVYVDIGFKSEGILPLTAFSNQPEPPAVGSTLLVSPKGRTPDGFYNLSLFRAPKVTDWSGLQKAFDEGTPVTATVTAVVKGGLRVDVGVNGFIPASRTGTRDAAEMEKLVGQEVVAKITKLDIVEEDVVLDRRVIVEAEAAATRGERFAQLSEGEIVTGTVRSLMDYGAFIDLGGIDGLLHISDISWTRINKPSDVLELGQELSLQVLKADSANQKLSLGLKQLQPHPWDTVSDSFKEGDRVKGVVTRTTDFGAFVEIAPGVEGLVHLSEMSWSKRIHKATEVVNVGDVIEAQILGISPDDRRISLGLKQTLGDPWVEAAQKIVPGSVVEGPVASLTKFGAFIQIAEGVQGLVHISEIVADKRIAHPSDVLRVGEIVKAQVLEIDKERRQLRLSIKGLVPTGLDEFIEEQQVGNTVTGRVVSVDGNTARVELGEGILVFATIPAAKSETAAPASTGAVDLSAFSAMLKDKWKTGPSAASTKSSDEVKAGQVRSFKITALDADSKKLEVAFA